MAEGDTWINGLIGGVITIVAGSVVPLVPILGGAVSGYLEGGDRNSGLKVGVIAGLVAFIPFMLLLLAATTILGSLGIGLPMMGANGALMGFGAGLGIMVLVIGFVFGLIYLVGLSAVGGVLGNYVKNDTDIDI